MHFTISYNIWLVNLSLKSECTYTRWATISIYIDAALMSTNGEISPITWLRYNFKNILQWASSLVEKTVLTAESSIRRIRSVYERTEKLEGIHKLVNNQVSLHAAAPWGDTSVDTRTSNIMIGWVLGLQYDEIAVDWGFTVVWDLNPTGFSRFWHLTRSLWSRSEMMRREELRPFLALRRHGCLFSSRKLMHCSRLTD